MNTVAKAHDWEKRPGSIRRSGSCFLLIGALILGGASLAGAQSEHPLREANRIYETGDIDGAIIAYGQAIETPGNSVRDLLLIHRRLGLLRAATGDIEGASAHFALAIAMAPDTPALSELSPQLRDYWEQTRARQEPIEIRLEPTGHVTNEDVTEIEISVLNTPEGAVASVALTIAVGNGSPWVTSMDGVGPGIVQIPASAWNEAPRIQVRAQALDPFAGGIIAESRMSLNSTALPSNNTPLAEPPADIENPNTLPWIIAGSGAALVVAGSITGILALSQESSLADSCPHGLCPAQVDLASEQSSVQTMALVTDILLLTGVAAVATGVTMLLLHGGDSDEPEPNVPPTTVSVVCAPAGCAASATVRF